MFTPFKTSNQPWFLSSFQIQGADRGGGNIPANQPVELKEGDIITFGVALMRVKLLYEPLVLSQSQLGEEEKITLKDCAKKIGAHIVDRWIPEVTHVVSSTPLKGRPCG